MHKAGIDTRKTKFDVREAGIDARSAEIDIREPGRIFYLNTPFYPHSYFLSPLQTLLLNNNKNNNYDEQTTSHA